MVALSDSSVLVAAMAVDHPQHAHSFQWLRDVKNGKIHAAISTHTLAESFSSLTVLPITPPLTPPHARDLIQRNVLGFFQLVSLGKRDYRRAMDRVAEKNLKSGAIYDALIFEAALKIRASHLVTWNRRHFERLSQGEVLIVTPETLS